MAITVNLRYRGAGARDFAKEMTESGTVDAIRAEDGNLRYEYFVPFDGGDFVLLIDSWRDQESLDRHHASPMMATISALREKYDLRMEAERYTCEEVPSKDEAFIRK